MRKSHMEHMETIMVNLASPEARRALGREKDMGQKTRSKRAHHRRTSTAMAAAAAVRPKRPTTGAAKKKRRTLRVPMER